MLKHLYLITLLLTAPLFACDQTNNSSETKVTPLLQQYPSNNLEELTKQLKQGLPKEDVEKILGLPDYSPIDGLFYYSSEGSASLVVDYRNEKDEITTKLQSFWIGEVGE